MNLVGSRAVGFEPTRIRSPENDSQMLDHEPKCVDPVALVCIYASVRICCSLACSEQGVSAGVLLVKDGHE